MEVGEWVYDEVGEWVYDEVGEILELKKKRIGCRIYIVFGLTSLLSDAYLVQSENVYLIITYMEFPSSLLFI